MKQLERIQKMEERFNLASAAVKKLSEAVEEYAEVQQSLNELSDYLGSKEWKKDFASDEKGLLPPDLKRGVLSEDDTLLREILFNPRTKSHVEQIRAELKELIQIIDDRDEDALNKYLMKIRANIK